MILRPILHSLSYPVHYQLLPNTDLIKITTNFYWIQYFLLAACIQNQYVNDIKLSWQALPSIIQNSMECVIWYYRLELDNWIC